jgi:ribonuclease BN (tRNA processing enzyme)
MESVLTGLLAPAVWPIRPRSGMTIRSVESGEVPAEGFGVIAFPLSHPGRALGYRITCQSGRSVSYVTDNELAAMHPAQRQSLVHAVAGSDVLIHDATWTDDILAQRSGWGHSSGTEAALLGLDAGCATVVLFHHDPDADDAALDRQLEAARERVATPGGPQILVAADGLILDL